MRAISPGGVVSGTTTERNAADCDGPYFDGRRARRPYDTGMCYARIPGARNWALSDGTFDRWAAAEELQLAIADGHFGQQTSRGTLRASRISHGEDVRGRG